MWLSLCWEMTETLQKAKKVLCPGLQLGTSVQAGARSLCRPLRSAPGPAVFPLFSPLGKHLLLGRVPDHSWSSSILATGNVSVDLMAVMK